MADKTGFAPPAWERQARAWGWLPPEEAEKLREKADHPIHVAEVGWLAPEPARRLVEAAQAVVDSASPITGELSRQIIGAHVPPNDIEALRDALAEALDDPAVTALKP